jgi:hypothetical protein
MDLDEDTLEALGWGSDKSLDAIDRRFTAAYTRFVRLRAIHDVDKKLRAEKNARYYAKLKRDVGRYAKYRIGQRKNNMTYRANSRAKKAQK